MTATNVKNAEYWQRYGEYVLMAMPYADEVLVKGSGCTVTDSDGKELLDLASGMFCCVLGHNHPEFIRRVVRQTEALLHTGTQFLSPPVLEAGYKLAQVAPGRLSKSIFLSTGTEANEFAFRLAKAYTGRTGIVGFSRGYYGTSIATKSVSSMASKTRCRLSRTVTDCPSRPNAAAVLLKPPGIPALFRVCDPRKIGWATGAISPRLLWSRSCRPVEC